MARLICMKEMAVMASSDNYFKVSMKFHTISTHFLTILSEELIFDAQVTNFQNFTSDIFSSSLNLPVGLKLPRAQNKYTD